MRHLLSLLWFSGLCTDVPPARKNREGDVCTKAMIFKQCWYLRKVQRISRWDNRRYSERFPLDFVLTLNLFTSVYTASANSQDKHGKQLTTSCTLQVRTHKKDSKVSSDWAEKHKIFLHQSKARTAGTVWNWSVKRLSPRTLLPVLYFSSRHFFPPV